MGTIEDSPGPEAAYRGRWHHCGPGYTTRDVHRGFSRNISKPWLL